MNKKMWAFEGDFQGCFDNLNHDYILEKVNDFPQKKLITKWLKAGFIDNHVFNESFTGTPQGGIVSPLLANIALHGMEEELRIKYKMQKHKNYPEGRWVINDYRKRSPKISMVRYADDFVILCESKEKAMALYAELQPYLEKRGLRLAKDKTRVTKITNGFDFLGFTFRKFYKKNGTFKIIVKPSKETVKKARSTIKDVFVQLTGTNVKTLLMRVLPVIRGYANHWKRVVSKDIYSKMDHYIFQLTAKFLKRLHNSKSWKWIKKKCFRLDLKGQSKNKWLLTEDKYQIINMSWTSIVRHEKILGNNSPYDVKLKGYFKKRDIKQFKSDNVDSRQKMAKLQNYKCPLCDNSIVDFSEGLERHHKTPRCKGGDDSYRNVKLVHISCHIKHHIDFPAKGSIPTSKQLAQAKKLRSRQRKGMMLAKENLNFNSLIATFE
ncbi:group II intron reverse transcriptase [Bacillus thuringiensis]